MRIINLETTKVLVPFEKPIRTAIHDIRGVGCVLVRLDSDAEVSGEGILFTFDRGMLDALAAVVKSLSTQAIGEDPFHVERIWRAMWRAINFHGHEGLTIFALSAIDTACWDLIGKSLEKPLHHVFGACRDTVPAYASGGLWHSLDRTELVEEAKGFVAQGFRAMKIRVGKPDIAEDVARVEAVRAGVGDAIALMADANQGLDVDHAIRLGRALAPFDLTWFEEPVPAYDLDGHARIAAALDTPLASGETVYTGRGIKAMIEARAADILMPDLQRIGGPSEFRRAAALAAAAGLPVSPHVFTEQSLSLAGALDNVCYVEHMPWFQPLYTERLELIEGELLIPDRPGLGFTFDPEAIKRFRVD